MAGADRFVLSDPVRRRLRRLSRAEKAEEAVAFIRQFSRETGQDQGEARRREQAVRASIRREGHYSHTYDELVFGARVAWRNHARCVGRLTWQSLSVVDRRHVTEPGAIVAATAEDLQSAFRDGAVRSSISIFAPATETEVPPTFESAQLFQYAGHVDADGGVVGDRANVELTRTATRLGWRTADPADPFELLPVIMRDERGVRHAFALPPGSGNEIVLHHPTRPGLAALNLRWYGVPCVTNMVLTIGGIDYPCAPFNGHYVATEIASRNLVDVKRYDLLGRIAASFDIDRQDDDRSLWRDEALTELNRAVLHSFDAAGVRIADHHEVSNQYMKFERRERRAGRAVSGEWSWVVPPQASAGCPTFHVDMDNLSAVPNFYHSRTTDGAPLGIDRTHLRDGVWLDRFVRVKRRLRDWRRRRDRIWHRA